MLLVRCRGPLGQSLYESGELHEGRGKPNGTLKAAKNRNVVQIVSAHLCNELDLDDEAPSMSLQYSDVDVFESMFVSEEHISNTHEKELDDVEVLAVDAELLEHDNQSFLGACFDSDAQSTWETTSKCIQEAHWREL